MKNKLKVLIIAPFWNNPNHLSVYRIERFIRWFNNNSWEIVLLTSGTDEKVLEHGWGIEIIIKDRFKLASKFVENKIHKPPYQFLQRIWRIFSRLTFIPDQHIVWAKKVVDHPLLKEYIKGINIVLSSSPPESTHVASMLFSKRHSIFQIVDMRDGWLDEPLNPKIEVSIIRKYIEGKQEKKIISNASHIFVTSSIWQEKLKNRYPHIKNKLSVLTNGYPLIEKNITINKDVNSNFNSGHITLIHAGQFSLSRKTQKIKFLLEPILETIKIFSSSPNGKIILLGNMEPEELDELNIWKDKFNKSGWELLQSPYIPRHEMLNRIKESNGLLLLCASQASIPSKLFEYIPTTKPILAIAPEGSAVWQMCKGIPQVFLFDYLRNQKKDYSNIHAYLNACQTRDYKYAIPEEYSERCLSEIFLNTVNKITSQKI